jgi:hypothetical protein
MIGSLALEHWHERALRGSVPEVFQFKEIRDGAALVLLDAQPGAGQYVGLTHPVLGFGPFELADLVVVAADGGHVLARCGAPFTKQQEFGECGAGVQCPPGGGPWQAVRWASRRWETNSSTPALASHPGWCVPR